MATLPTDADVATALHGIRGAGAFELPTHYATFPPPSNHPIATAAGPMSATTSRMVRQNSGVVGNGNAYGSAAQIDAETLQASYPAAEIHLHVVVARDADPQDLFDFISNFNRLFVRRGNLA